MSLLFFKSFGGTADEEPLEESIVSMFFPMSVPTAWIKLKRDATLQFVLILTMLGSLYNIR